MATERRPLLGPAGLAAAVLFAASNLWWPVSAFDGGYSAVGASRVLAGALPFRDFWANYTPAAWCVNGALFGAFGKELWVLQAADLAWRLVLALAVALLARRAGGRGGAWVLVGALGLLGPASLGGVPIHAALALGALALLAWFRDGAAWPWVAGAGAGLASAFRQDIGLCVLLALTATEALRTASGRRGGGAARLARAWSAAGLVLLLVLAPFMLAAGPGTVFGQLLFGRSGAFSLPPVSPLPWRAFGSSLAAGNWRAADEGFQVWHGTYLGPLALLLAVAAGLRGIRRGDGRAPVQVALSLFGLALLPAALGRPDWFHLYPPSLVGLGVLPFLWEAHPRVGRALALLAALAWIALPAVDWGGYLMDLRDRRLSALPHSRGMAVAPDSLAVAAWLQSATPADSRILVLNADSTRGVSSDILLYFLADRAPATPQFILRFPPPPDYAEALRGGLADPRTAAVVLWDSGYGPGPSGLDREIRAFGPVAGGAGRYQVRVPAGRIAGPGGPGMNPDRGQSHAR